MDRFNNGETVRELSVAFAVSAGAKLRTLNEAQNCVARGPVEFTASTNQLKEILDRCKKGETLHAIGMLYGVSGRRIWSIIRCAGFDIRKFRRKHALEILGTREPIAPFLREVPVPPARRRILELMAKRPDLNYQEVAAISGCTRQNVQEFLKRHAECIERFRRGESVKARQYIRKDRDFMQRVVEMYNQRPAVEVAKAFKISAHSVLNYARKLGFRKKLVAPKPETGSVDFAGRERILQANTAYNR